MTGHIIQVKNKNQACTLIFPVTAAKAIGILQEKATPKPTWGNEVKRFINGYNIVKAAPITANVIVRGLQSHTNTNASKLRNAAKLKASFTFKAPLARGRCAVRLTCPSMFLSMISFMAQPADRINTVPTIKTNSSVLSGNPPLASHKAHNVGHNNSNMPIGLFNRIKETY
jgi:hypothetical protein